MTTVLTSALTGLTAYGADDAPATTQPANTKPFVIVRDGVSIVPDGSSEELQKQVSKEVEGAMRSALGKTEKGAFLGVSTSPAPLALLKQLKIKTGLVIDAIVPGSPADTAGLKPQDIIQKLDDQILLNASQLEGLIRIHNAGDSVTLSLLHEGDHTTATAKLVEHVLLVAQEADPSKTTESVLKMFPIDGGATDLPAKMKIYTDQPNANPNVRVQVFTGGSATSSNSNGVTHFQSQYSDGKYQLTMNRQGDRHILTIKDSDGKELFAGPVDTAAEQNVIPADLLPKFREMQKMEHLTDDVAKP
jgi:hypothetical protein